MQTEIEIKCPKCGAALKIPAYIDKFEVHCPACGQVFATHIEENYVSTETAEEAPVNKKPAKVVLVTICLLALGLWLAWSSGLFHRHTWVEATASEPKHCSSCGEMIPMETPADGQIFFDITSGSGARSELTIKSSSSESYFIKLKNEKDLTAFAFFVGAGRTVSVSVPAGYYRVFFAGGKDWYGPVYLFGEDTSYGKDEDILDFVGSTWEYTLYPVSDGNFSETPISSEEFWE